MSKYLGNYFPMLITYDPESDAAYIYLVDRIGLGDSKHQVEMLGGRLVVDLDTYGRILGIEVLSAANLLRPETLAGAARR